ncbi:hypothetical protein V6N13_011341 [Hibiscus sabdariffa]|uniref:ATP-dependent RNA helicase n=1 Tax=Hibiscus sabdariffa TaxID=183260 RepID=A0ABR2SC11_9ROSI
MCFSSLFPVQVAVWQETIGSGASERDLCINSPTGSRKTLAYALPIVQKLSTSSVKSLRALVKEVFAAIAPEVEDVPFELQSSVDMLVATPGRLMYHISSTNGFTLEHLCYLICEPNLRPLYLFALLLELGEEKCTVFTSSTESTHRLCTLLNLFGDLSIKIKEYSGLQRQSLRSKTLKSFREGKVQVLVCSDAMTRGMDVEG